MTATIHNVLKLMSTSELASAQALASNSPQLSDFDRCAILAGIQAEFAERDTMRKGAFEFASEREQLQAVIEVKEEKIFQLECEISLLGDLLEQEKKASGKAKSGA